jgi:hypothetical protein
VSRTRKRTLPTSWPVINGRRLSARQAAALRAAARAEAAGDAATARRLRLRLEGEIDEATHGDWLAGALADTAALERTRGQAVEAAPGRVRIHGRDGLETLTASGALTAAQRAAALRYRGRFEDAQPRIASVLAIRPGGARGRPDRPEAVAARMAQARRDVDRLEQAVADRYAAEGRPALAGDALLALREVAGLGRSIRELASSGHRREVLKTRLGEGLDALTPIVASAGGRRCETR